MLHKAKRLGRDTNKRGAMALRVYMQNNGFYGWKGALRRLERLAYPGEYAEPDYTRVIVRDFLKALDQRYFNLGNDAFWKSDIGELLASGLYNTYERPALVTPAEAGELIWRDEYLPSRDVNALRYWIFKERFHPVVVPTWDRSYSQIYMQEKRGSVARVMWKLLRTEVEEYAECVQHTSEREQGFVLDTPELVE